MLVPPASSVGDFVRDISLFRLIVVIEMPGQIPDGTEPGDEQEESTLGGPARDKTREKILDLFQNYLSTVEHGSLERDRMRELWQYAINDRRNEAVIWSLVPVCG
jgi:hypothetical protein